MSMRQGAIDTEIGTAVARMCAASELMNQILIEHLDAEASRANPPGKTRTIAAIFTHVHNVRCKWVRLTAPHLPVPAQLQRTHCTPQQALAGLAESGARCQEMLAEALGGGGRIQKFHRDGWAPAWPPGVEMLCYMLSHEAHHRGQVCLLAAQMGFALPKEVSDGIWNWERLWRRQNMKKPDASESQAASELISKRIAELGDWRGQTLGRMRQLIQEADPDAVEEWKWRGTPVWSHDGIICTGESYKSVVKLTFAQGASLSDPGRLFNSSLEGNTRRAIDIHEGEEVDGTAFKALVQQAAALNRARKSKKSSKKTKSSKS